MALIAALTLIPIGGAGVVEVSELGDIVEAFRQSDGHFLLGFLVGATANILLFVPFGAALSLHGLSIGKARATALSCRSRGERSVAPHTWAHHFARRRSAQHPRSHSGSLITDASHTDAKALDASSHPMLAVPSRASGNRVMANDSERSGVRLSVRSDSHSSRVRGIDTPSAGHIG